MTRYRSTWWIILFCQSFAIHAPERRQNLEMTVEYGVWYQDHKENCAINYTGSSNAMEAEVARRIMVSLRG